MLSTSPATRIERPILPLFSLVEIADRVLIHRSGRLTLVYRIDAFHEPALDDPDFEHVALQLTHTWSALPEKTSYQFLVTVDAEKAAGLLDDVFRPVPEGSPRQRLYAALRGSVRERFEGLTRAEGGAARELLQARQHFLAVSFEPEALRRARTRERLRFLKRHRRAQIDDTYAEALGEAALVDQATTRALVDLGLGYERLDDDGLARLMHALLSPDTARERPLERLSRRLRDDRDELPDSVLREHPFLADTSPLHELTDDPLVIDRRFLRQGGSTPWRRTRSRR